MDLYPPSAIKRVDNVLVNRMCMVISAIAASLVSIRWRQVVWPVIVTRWAVKVQFVMSRAADVNANPVWLAYSVTFVPTGIMDFLFMDAEVNNDD